MHVRILAPKVSPSKLIGTVDQVSDDLVTLDVFGRTEPVLVPREKIVRWDVSDAARSRGIDAVIGAGVGAAIGAAIPTEHWKELSATHYRVGIMPRLDHGLDLAVAWNF